MSPRARVYLFDTNSIIEGVRIGAWNALCGGLEIQSVEECEAECRRGDSLSSGYISVQETALSRMKTVHPVSEEQRAALLLQIDASALDPGELDLHAHALSRDDSAWSICSPDRASVKIGVGLRWQDRLVSLEELMNEVGFRPQHSLRRHFLKAWLSQRRTEALLGI